MTIKILTFHTSSKKLEKPVFLINILREIIYEFHSKAIMALRSMKVKYIFVGKRLILYLIQTQKLKYKYLAFSVLSVFYRINISEKPKEFFSKKKKANTKNKFVSFIISNRQKWG